MTKYEDLLPDKVYGSANTANLNDHRKMVITLADHSDGSVIINVFLGGVYVYITERNWNEIYSAITTARMLHDSKKAATA